MKFVVGFLEPEATFMIIMH